FPGQLSRELLAACKKQWQRAAIFALVCPESDRLLDMVSVLSEVDDFLSCPFANGELFLRIKRLLHSTKLSSCHVNNIPAHTNTKLGLVVGKSAAFARVLEKVLPLAQAKAPVLVLGETGTGKELLSRALHYQGPRHGKPFIPVNCGALPDHLFENELFGHIKGAYTDASFAQQGLIAEAEKGTLFLDEVDALSESGQVKLLRFLQNGEYRPLGSSRGLT